MVISAFATPILIWVAINAKTNTDDVNNWIDKTSTEYAEYLVYTRRFGSDDEIVVSWDGCTIDDPRLPLVVSYVRRECSDIADRVVSGEEAVSNLRRSASRFSSTNARRRLRGSLFGDNLKTTCLVVRLNAIGRSNLSQALSRIDSAVRNVAGIDPDEVHYGGKAISDHSLNSMTNQSLLWGIPGAILAVIVVLLCIRNVRLATGMIFVSSFAGLVSFAIVPLFGIQVNGLLVLMPILVFVMTLGCAVHMVRTLQQNFAATGASALNPNQTIQKSLAESRLPVVLAMITTAIGIASLTFSPISAVFQFGLFSSVSILLSLLFLMTLLPAIWYCFGIGNSKTMPSGALKRIVEQLMRLNRYPRLTIVLFIILAVPAAFGLSRFETDLDTSKLFGATTDISMDQQWIEDNLYPLGRVDFVIGFDKQKLGDRFRQLQCMRKIQATFRKDNHYHSALSAANFIRIPRSATPFQRQLTERVIATQIDYDYEQLHDEGMLYSSQSHDYWRITVACSVDDENDERTVADRLEHLARNSLEDNPDRIEVQTTGMGPLAASGQRRLFVDLARGLMTALIVITPLLILFLKSPALGILAMIPNVLPILLVFGYCGLVGRKLDIGAILTASVGLGIAIDDTVHFLHYYKLGLRSADSQIAVPGRSDAVTFAIRRCTSPIITTTVIVCCGLFFFTFSQFLPVRNFAICLMLLMITAAFADLDSVTGAPQGFLCQRPQASFR